MNVAAPFLCPYSIKPSGDDGERGALAVTAFKIAGREMHLHEESAAPGRSRAIRRKTDCARDFPIRNDKRLWLREGERLGGASDISPDMSRSLKDPE
jgi:hypothetical protein